MADLRSADIGFLVLRSLNIQRITQQCMTLRTDVLPLLFAMPALHEALRGRAIIAVPSIIQVSG